MTQMTECKGRVLCYSIQGIVSLQDYESFMKHLTDAVHEYGSINLLFYYTPEFKGWQPEAADANMKAILDFGRSTDRLAYVNPPEKKIMQHKIAPELFGGEMKYFDKDKLAEAIEWIKAA